MTISSCARPLDAKMSWRRGKTSGWTAFDLEHRRKQGLEPEAKGESFPEISSSMDQDQKALTNTANKTALDKPFASLLQGAVNFPIKQKCSDMDEQKFQGGSSSASADYLNAMNGVKDAFEANEMLKELHPWADQSLIEDVLAGVNYDVDKASSLLKMMVSYEQSYNDAKVIGTEELKFNHKESLVNENKSLAEKDTKLAQVSCFLEGHVYKNNQDLTDEAEKDINLAQMSCLLEGPVCKNNQDLTDEHTSSRKMLLHDVSATKMILNSIKYLPIEPEWEEDDLYLIKRKDARKMMSSASRNSKAANEAYQRGDHLSAQLCSRKAREEWLTAERLNAKAAKEILSIRNSKNDEWTLDLHGLHAAEAVQALQEHLQRVESQMPTKQLACASRVNATTGIVLSTVPEVAIFRDLDKCGSQIPSSRTRPTSVQVITGKGNHSRGEAALPAAIRSFLNENGYHYSEARPGVIEVQVKFRR
ncbi:uncharacterized protein [Coffea arabica]|uniref:Uncharacterized protein isoform X1 n=2 Tax=Coffea arabica TaxID=13443 RepID=A0A6P6TA19_COFAR|nr:uncharacterized protein LOC113699228 isoform X1 [Coffea arabica]